MPIVIDCVTFDCADPQRLAAFWTAVLGYTVRENTDGWMVLQPGSGQGPLIGLQQVPRQRSSKTACILIFR